MRMFLSIQNVKQLVPGNYDVRDAPGDSRRQQAAIAGFVLRMRATGRHAYFLNFRRGRWIKIGDAAKLTADQARELAKNLGGRVASGADPVEERRDARREAVAGTTLRDFVTRHYRPWAIAHLRGAVEALRKLDAIAATELGDLALDAITPFAVERWRTHRLKSKRKGKRISPATVNREMGDLKAAIGKAVLWKHLSADPLSGVKLAKIDRIGVVRFLEPEEERRLRAALTARDDAHRVARERFNVWRRERQYDELPPLGTYADGLTPIVLVAMNTGLRFGELANMRWRDVDQRRAMLTVVGTGTKSQQTRYVPLNTEAVDVLQTWGGTKPDPAAYVFPGRDGGRLVDVKTAWGKVLEAAVITRFRFHDLRHHFASRLVQNGVDLNTVRELLGHSDLKMTLRYSHLAPEHKAAAVAKLVSAS